DRIKVRISEAFALNVPSTLEIPHEASVANRPTLFKLGRSNVPTERSEIGDLDIFSGEIGTWAFDSLLLRDAPPEVAIRVHGGVMKNGEVCEPSSKYLKLVQDLRYWQAMDLQLSAQLSETTKATNFIAQQIA